MSTSVGEFPKLAVTNIWPNPTRGWLNISLGEQAVEHIDLSITDMQGRIVIEEKLKTGRETHRLNLSNMPSGTYLLRLTDGQRSYSEKIIHQ